MSFSASIPLDESSFIPYDDNYSTTDSEGKLYL